MEDNDQQLQQLLNNSNWSAADREWLLAYLENTETQELRGLLLDVFAADVNTGVKIDDQISERMRQRIASHTGINMAQQQAVVIQLPAQDVIPDQISKRKPGRGILKWSAIAASILLLAGFGWKYIFRNIPKQETADHTITNNKPFPVTIRNTSHMAMAFVLPDSSRVDLMPGSQLTYTRPFAVDKRTVALSGEALFKVAKDKTKPFTVYSGAIATTVLGTVFRVTAFDSAQIINVKLFEGKVVIGAADTNNRKINQVYYLLSGDEFYFNRQSLIARVTNHENAGAAIKNNIPANKKLPATNWYMFNNQNLAQVFDQLSGIYNIKIEYTAREIRNMNFIGKIEKTDSIENILNDIALLNNLSIKKEGNRYVVTRK